MWYRITVPPGTMVATHQLLKARGFQSTTVYPDGVWVVCHTEREELLMRMMVTGTVEAYKDMSNALAGVPVRLLLEQDQDK